MGKNIYRKEETKEGKKNLLQMSQQLARGQGKDK